VPLVGFTLQSFSLPKSGAPFDVLALLPFLIIPASCSEDQKANMSRGSRALFPSEVRTARPRVTRPMLSWASKRLSRVFPVRPSERLPAPFPLALLARDLEEVGNAALQGLARHTSRHDLAAAPSLMRFFTGIHPSGKPGGVRSYRLPDGK
jgi:hypothetical protein